MTDLRKAAEMALEALERSMEAGLTGIKVDEAITAIRIALDDPLKSSDAYRVAVAVRDACHKAWVLQMENWGDINIKDIIETTIGNQALAQPEQSNSIWVLTREINEYKQDGEYFVDAWNTKPTHQMLSALGVSQNRLRHILNGGGRVGYENEWFYLKEIKHD